MKPRSREVNIFNMSLLDILCGALGAFCFMMLGLLPYYKPNQSGAGGTSGSVRDMQKQIQDQQQQINELTSRNTLIVEASWTNPQQDIDIFVDRGGIKSSDNRQEPSFDPTKKQSTFWKGDQLIDKHSGPATESYVIRYTWRETYRIYYKIFQNGNNAVCAVTGYVFAFDDIYRLPTVVLDRDKSGICIGKLVISDDRTKVRFVGSTPELQKKFEEENKNFK